MVKTTDFIKDSKAEFKREQIIVKGGNGKEYPIMVNTKLKDTDIMTIVDNVVVRSEMCKKEGIKFDVVMSIYALLIKYFTDIKFSEYPNIKKQFSHELDMLKAMIDLGIFEQLIKQFNPEEVMKVQNIFDKYKDSFKEINNNILAKEILGGDEDGKNL